MSAGHDPIPPGAVSAIRGQWQRPILTGITWIVLALSVVSAALPGDAGTVVGVVVIAAVIATPLLRVAWLVLRWAQEDDRTFVLAGLGLLGVVGIGALLAAMGVAT